jgi:hypothetical protein
MNQPMNILAVGPHRGRSSRQILEASKVRLTPQEWIFSPALIHLVFPQQVRIYPCLLEITFLITHLMQSVPKVFLCHLHKVSA